MIEMWGISSGVCAFIDNWKRFMLSFLGIYILALAPSILLYIL